LAASAGSQLLDVWERYKEMQAHQQDTRHWYRVVSLASDIIQITLQNVHGAETHQISCLAHITRVETTCIDKCLEQISLPLRMTSSEKTVPTFNAMIAR